MTLGKHLNFTKAAEDLHIAQTSLSQQISTIENQLGMKLFTRNNRSVKLTAAGEVFAEEAKHIIMQYEDAVIRAKQAADGVKGNLKIGWWGHYEILCLSEVLKIFHELYANIMITYYQDDLNHLINALRTGRIDILFIPLHFFKRKDDLAYKTISSSPLCLAVNRNHPLSRKKQVFPDDLSNEKFISINFTETDGAYEKFLWQCTTMGFIPNLISQPRSFQEIDSMVYSGLGVTIYPKTVKNRVTAKLSFLPITGHRVDTAVDVVWLKGNNDPTVSLFTEILNDSADSGLL
jgi:DNA-binding transcriptional LysR family regulator